jgi:type II secretory pathway pseudopilin PulG
MINLINNIINRIRKRLKKNQGMTIVEVVIAFFIIAIISTVLVRGTIAAVNTMRINKAKTEAIAIANEKIEIMKSINYLDIPIMSGTEEEYDDLIAVFPELDIPAGDYSVDYEVVWANAEENGCKQVKVSISGDNLNIPIEVVSQFYPPAGEEATGGNVFPPPEELVLQSDTGTGDDRIVSLQWLKPETEKTIHKYLLYRDNQEPIIVIWTDDVISYNDSPLDDLDHSYYVTAVYEGNIESVASNTVSTGTPVPYPPPQNLAIDKYDPAEGDDRTVYLVWEAPDTELEVINYKIYREDSVGSIIEVGINEPDILTYNEIIGLNNYTYYVTAIYIGENESDPSNTQTTE